MFPFGPTDHIGLLGFHYDMHPCRFMEDFYFGIGGYGAIYGNEGGFFVMGGTVGRLFRLDERLTFDTGLFVGGGGGADRVFGGGGLMTRVHAYGDFRLGNLSWFGGLAYTDFPDTPNEYHDDLHFAVGMKLHDYDWHKQSYELQVTSYELKDELPEFDGEFEQWRIAPVSMVYHTLDSIGMQRDGGFTGGPDDNADFQLLGVQIDASMNSWLYQTFEVYGAYGGGADGYAAFFGGFGVSVPVIRNILYWDTRLLGGLGGDSRIDTGSGLMAHLCTGIRIYITDHFGLKASTGRIKALGGKFASNTVDFGIFSETHKPKADNLKIYRFPRDNYSISDWSISLTNKTYLPSSESLRDDGSTYHAVQHLFGFVLNKPVADWFTITGSTHWAYEGNIGSYAEGMFGCILHPSFLKWDELQMNLSGEFGVAGGGNSDVDEGKIYQTTLGVEYPITENLSIEIRAGKVGSTGHTFKADAIQLQLNWKQESVFTK